jgi:hypothetical protein
MSVDSIGGAGRLFSLAGKIAEFKKKGETCVNLTLSLSQIQHRVRVHEVFSLIKVTEGRLKPAPGELHFHKVWNPLHTSAGPKFGVAIVGLYGGNVDLAFKTALRVFVAARGPERDGLRHVTDLELLHLIRARFVLHSQLSGLTISSVELGEK